MHVPTLILAVAIEIYLALILAAALLVFFSLKQKKLIRRQQEKLRELIATIKTVRAPAQLKPYRQLVSEELKITLDRFELIAPKGDISAIQPPELPTEQRILALRHAFLRAEESGAAEGQGSEGYWNVFQHALAPLLQPSSTAIDFALDLGSDSPLNSNDELETYKRRVENLEKFKSLFFDLEKRWNEAQSNAQGYYNELYAMADGVEEQEIYKRLLGQYSNSYNDMSHYMQDAGAAITSRPIENKVINIIRQDPRAADEIMKLRNVAADQYRVISNLQRKLEEAVTSEAKDLVIKELEQQLHRQVRFVQESDTCVQLLEEELNKAHEKIAAQEDIIGNDQHLTEENQRIKETLQSFTQESKELLGNLEVLEKENDQLKNDLEHPDMERGASPADLQQIQTEFAELRKQYTDLEEKYLELKFK
jgi:hypothetical protein